MQTRNFVSGSMVLVLGLSSTACAQVQVPFVEQPNQHPAFLSADLTGDGRDEWVRIAAGENRVDIRLNNGDSHEMMAMAGLRHFVAVGQDPRDLTAADLDGDGLPELCTADFYGSITILWNKGGLVFAEESVEFPSKPIALAAADLDRDGDLDLVVSQWEASSLALLINNGGTLVKVGGQELAAPAASVTAADLNADGWPDLILTHPTAGGWSLLYGGAQLSFSGLAINSGGQPADAVVQDMNGDGVADVIIGNFGLRCVQIYINDGIFEAAPATVELASAPLELVPGGSSILYVTTETSLDTIDKTANGLKVVDRNVRE